MIVFSASGLTAVPIEIAIGAKARGLPVVAVVRGAVAGGGGDASDRRAAARPRGRRPRPLHAGRRARRARGARRTRRARLDDRRRRARERGQGADRRAPARARRPPAGAHERRRRRQRGSRGGSSTRPMPSTPASRAPLYACPTGLPAASHRGRYSREKSSFATIVAAPITPARSSSAERRTVRSRVAKRQGAGRSPAGSSPATGPRPPRRLPRSPINDGLKKLTIPVSICPISRPASVISSIAAGSPCLEATATSAASRKPFSSRRARRTSLRPSRAAASASRAVRRRRRRPRGSRSSRSGR